MTAKEIVMAMIDGLEKEWVKIDFYTFGSKVGKTCFGCAATNAICQIIDDKNIIKHLLKLPTIYGYFNIENILKDADDRVFMKNFEFAINQLRLGNIKGYNEHAKKFGFSALPPIKKGNKKLPQIYNANWKENIHFYKEYADTLD